MAKKSLIYDGACTLCIRSKNTLIALGLASKEEVWAYQEMPDEYVKQVSYERFRHEMALIDHVGGATLYGPEAIAFLLCRSLPFLSFIFEFGPFRRAFAFVYKIIALNRTAIMVPKTHKIRCASCEPDTPAAYRWYWICLALGLGVGANLLTGLFDLTSLNEYPFYFGFLFFCYVFYLLLENFYPENYLEIAAHAASFLMIAMGALSIGFWIIHRFGGAYPLSLCMIPFIPILLFLGREYHFRTNYLSLSSEGKVLGSIGMVILLLVYYFALIF